MDGKDWKSSAALSADLTAWLEPSVGVQLGTIQSPDAAVGTSLPSSVERFHKAFYDTGLVLRYWGNGSRTVVPYMLLGFGVLTLHRSGLEETQTGFVTSYGAGLLLRKGRLGVALQVRDLDYRVKLTNLPGSQRDYLASCAIVGAL